MIVEKSVSFYPFIFYFFIFMHDCVREQMLAWAREFVHVRGRINTFRCLAVNSFLPTFFFSIIFLSISEAVLIIC